MRVSVCVFLIFIQFTSFSQQWLGISASNYSGTYGIYTNPANVADTRYKAVINLAGANVDFINNYASWGAPYSLFGLLTNRIPDRYRNDNGKILYRNDYLRAAPGKESVTAFLGTDVRGPSLMFTLEKAKMAIGITTRGRLLTNLNNTSSFVAGMLVSNTILPSEFGVPQRDNHFAMNINGYVEIGMTLGKVILDDDEHMLKAGLTVKRVNALMNVHLIARDADYVTEEVVGESQKLNLFFENAVGTFGMKKDESISFAGFTPDWLFGKTPAGFGYGLDIGFVYEYRPDFANYTIRLKDRKILDITQNKYLYKFGIALLDIGQMRFKDDSYVVQTNIAKSNILVPPGTFTDVVSLNKFYDVMNTAFGISDEDYRHQFNVPLPAVISATFDYAFSDKIYMNATWIHNIRNTKTVGMNQPSLLAIIPRWETKWLEASLPILLYNGYRNPAIGLAGRAGPLFIGTDNLPALLNIGKPRGLNAYFGLSIPIFRKLPEPPCNCYYEPKTGMLKGVRDFFKKRKGY